MEGGTDEIYNFKSSSSVSTNYNSRPRISSLNDRKLQFKNQQLRSISPNTFQPLYLEQKCQNSKNNFVLKKKNLSNNMLKNVIELNQSCEMKQSICSQGDRQQPNSKRAVSTNALAYNSLIDNYNNNEQVKQKNRPQSEIRQTSDNKQKEALSTNNNYYNQFYNVKNILNNKTENNLDMSSSFIEYNSSVKNEQSLNKTQASEQLNSNSKNLIQELYDNSQFQSNNKNDMKRNVLTENVQINNKGIRSLSRSGQRNTSSQNSRKINVLQNCNNFVNKSNNETLIHEGSQIKPTVEDFLDEEIELKTYEKRNQNYIEQKKQTISDEKENQKLMSENDLDKSQSHVKKEYMDDKEIKNISFYIDNMMYEDFKVYTDAQLLSKMDRESLIIRLQILEQENKEIKCHNLHLSSKFKEMLNEYTRYKEYQENVDRKSLYQKHVQKLAELSKTCHNQIEIIEQKKQKISQLQEIIMKKDNDLSTLQKSIESYDLQKQQDILEIENKFKKQISEYQERIEYLNKENRKIPLLEKSYKDIVDNMKEEKTKFQNTLEKQEERYKLIMNKNSEKEREIWHLKEKIKELEYQIKSVQEQNVYTFQEKCKEYDKILSKKEIDQHALNLQHQKQEKLLLADIKQLNDQNSDLRKQMIEIELKSQEKQQSLSNVIQQQTEEYQQYKHETINQIGDILSKNETLENSVEQKIQIIEEKKKELQQKNQKITELNKKIESLIQSKNKMEEDHLQEMSKLSSTQQTETQSLNFKMKELKLYYEVQMENLKKDCDDRVKEHSTNANDAQRQYFAMKNNYSNDIEGKENEIEFLKNKIYEEKQKIKDNVESQYKDMIKDMQKRVTFLQGEIDEQKIEIENKICEDLAVYNRQSKYWKKSRDIREEKYSLTINSEDTKTNPQTTPLKKKQGQNNKLNNQQISQQDILKIKFTVIAKCAVAFEEQQQKIDNLRQKVENLSKKINNILKQQYLGAKVSNNNFSSQQIKNLSIADINEMQQINNQFNLQRQNAIFEEEDAENIQFETDLFMNENELKDLELVKQVKDLRDQLYQQKLKTQEIQNEYIKREYEKNEANKLQQKQQQEQFNNLNSVKIQQVFEKDILIEKQLSKIAELQRIIEESTQLNQSQTEFVQKMKKQFKELDDRNQKIIEQIQEEKDELLNMWENRESLPSDIREIENLNQLIQKQIIEIKQLKNQIQNLHFMKNNGNTVGGLVIESQLRTSQNLSMSQKLQVESSSNSYSTNNNANLNSSNYNSLEVKNKSDQKGNNQKANLNKSIHIPSQREIKREITRPRTKSSVKSEIEITECQSFNEIQNN